MEDWAFAFKLAVLRLNRDGGYTCPRNSYVTHFQHQFELFLSFFSFFLFTVLSISSEHLQRSCVPPATAGCTAEWLWIQRSEGPSLLSMDPFSRALPPTPSNQMSALLVLHENTETVKDNMEKNRWMHAKESIRKHPNGSRFLIYYNEEMKLNKQSWTSGLSIIQLY